MERKASSVFILLGFSALLFLDEAAQADAFDYQVELVGGHHVVQGTNLHLAISLQEISGSPLAGVVPLNMLNLPPGVTYRMPNIDNNGACCGAYPNYGLYGVGGGTGGDWIELSVPNTTPAGDYTITIQATAPSTPPLVRSATFVVTVMRPSDIAIVPAPLLPAVPIPHLTDWESAMLQYGAPLCNQSTIARYEQGVWYYDGERVFYQIGDYRNEPSWGATCAQWVENVYTSSIFARNSAGPGYEVFSRGLRIDAEKTGNPISKKALHLLAQGDNYYEYTREIIGPLTMRESAYGLEAMLDDEAVNGASYPFDTTSMEAMLGQLDQLFIAKQFNVYYSPFMVGLMANALIQYYEEKNPDPRIPYYLKKTLDEMWNVAWSDTEHGFNYQCWPDGCYSSAIDSGYFPAPAPYSHVVYPNLNLLIAPAYAWMYLHTGDPKDRERADRIFSDGVVYADISRGKEFSQNYRWSFDYVKWRKQANAQAQPLPPTVSPPTIFISSPSANTVLNGSAQFMATVSGSANIISVQFFIDGVKAGAAVIPPFEASALTYLFSNGVHTLTAVAYDEAGNQTTSAGVPILIANATTNTSFQQCPSAPLPTDQFEACYFNGAGGDWNGMYANQVWANVAVGNLVAARTEASADYTGGVTVLPAGVNNSFFLAIHQGNFNFPAGTYKFSLSRNNIGYWVYIDNQLVTPSYAWDPNDETYEPALPPSFEVTFPVNGQHLVRVEEWVGYNSPSPSFHLSWAPDPNPMQARPPILYWVSPSYGSGVATNSDILLTAKAFGLDGASIQKVDFFNNSTLLGTVTTPIGNSLYVYPWLEVPKGNYAVWAKVTDSNGASTLMSAIVLQVGDPPSISWASGSPSNGLVVSEGSTLLFPVLASASGAATIASVNIFHNGNVYASSTTADGPGHYTPSLPNMSYDSYLYAGNYSFTAKATDSNGVQSQTSPIAITVQSSSPTVTWVSPLTESGFAPGSTITMMATASGTLGATIQSVQFIEPGVGWVPATYINGQYTFTWPNVSAGTYELNVQATDSNGRQTSLGSNIEIGVHNPPTLSWIGPSVGSTFATGVTIPLTAQAMASGAAVILQVDFLNGSTLLGSASNLEAGGQYTLNWPTVPAGNYTIIARATDSHGLQTTLSAPINIIVKDSGLRPTVPISWTPSQLNWPDVIPLDGSITVSYGDLPVTSVQWRYTPIHAGASSAGGASSASFSSPAYNSGVIGSGTASFSPAKAGLTIGTYNVAVTVLDASGIVLAQGGKNITFVNSNLSTLKIYPNPWRADKHAGKSIAFDGLTVGTTMKIFTISGREVKELHTDGPTMPWDLTNDSGDKVASGVYLYLITDGLGDKVKGKVAVIR